METKNLTIREIAVLGMMIATLEAGKILLNAIPNVEIVTFLVIMYTRQFGKKTIYAVFAFVILECTMWGFGIWTVLYLYVWPLLSVVVYFWRRVESLWFWAIFSGIFGMCFGALGSLLYLFMGGIKTAFAWWIAGIPWDVVHGVSNFILMMVLYVPIGKVLKRLS